MSLGKMFAEMGPVGWTVMVGLIGLSVYSVGLMLDKYRRFGIAKRESRAFMQSFGSSLDSGKVKDAVMVAHQYPNAPVAKAVSAGVWEFQEGRKTVADAETLLGLVTRASERSADRTLSEMKKGLGGLATIGSTAPFIGLFGTIVGIINAFQGIATTGSGGVAAVSGGIAEALIATALGILVALPAVMGFNHFTVALERFQIEMSTTSAQLVDFLRKRAAKVPHAAPAHAVR